jgi:ABC-type glutathione transport system ATPase component
MASYPDNTSPDTSEQWEMSVPGAFESSTDSVDVIYKLRPCSTTDENCISLREVSPVDVSLRNISASVDHRSEGAKTFKNLFRRTPISNDEERGSDRSTLILDNLSADMPSGSLTAIIGASGSGKTTL